MKYPGLLFLSLLLCFTAQSQTKADSAAAVKVLNTLINLSKAGEHGKAASLILYTGEDEKTAFKVVSDYRKKEHRNLVDDFCMDIKEFLVDSKSKKISHYYTDSDNDGTWHVLELTCTYDDNRNKKITIEFLKINGKFLFGGLFD